VGALAAAPTGAGVDTRAWKRGPALGRRRATGEREGKQKPAAGSEGARTQRTPRAGGPAAPGARAGGDSLGEADDRLAAGITAEQQADEQRQERHCGQQEGAKLSHGGPG
jgi:hypothetical protein